MTVGSEPRRHVAGMLSGLDIRYDIADDGDVHPLVGRRMPDLDLVTADGPTRVATLLHTARPLLLVCDESAPVDVSPWADRVRLVHASAEDTCALPVVGDVPVPAAILVRPDGHVAWTGHLGDADLPAAIETWFGTAA